MKPTSDPSGRGRDGSVEALAFELADGRGTCGFSYDQLQVRLTGFLVLSQAFALFEDWTCCALFNIFLIVRFPSITIRISNSYPTKSLNYWVVMSNELIYESDFFSVLDKLIINRVLFFWYQV